MTASVSTSLTAKQSSATKDVSGMLSLHTRLQHEAEKIRKWKIQMEIELNQKVMFCSVVRYLNLSILCGHGY